MTKKYEVPIGKNGHTVWLDSPEQVELLREMERNAERHVARGPGVSEEEARAILARHGMPWDGPITPPRPNDHHPGYRAMDYNVVVYDRPRRAGKTLALAEAVREWQETDLMPFYQRLQQAVDELSVPIRNAYDQLRKAGLIADPGEEHDDDPKVRALALRRNRNTGPARPSGQAARRPRRHN